MSTSHVKFDVGGMPSACNCGGYFNGIHKSDCAWSSVEGRPTPFDGSSPVSPYGPNAGWRLAAALANAKSDLITLQTAAAKGIMAERKRAASLEEELNLTLDTLADALERIESLEDELAGAAR